MVVREEPDTHDPSKYPHPESMKTSDSVVYVWMNYQGDGGASRILSKMSPDRTGEMNFLKALNTSISLEMDKSGEYTSPYPMARFAGGRWRHNVLDKRVDLEKLTQEDFKLSGEFRAVDEHYQRWRIRPEFREQGTDAYVPLDQLFPKDRLHQCYELIVQTPEFTQVVGSGYLHEDRGDVSLGVLQSGVQGRKQEYSNSSPVWFHLLDDAHQPLALGPVDLLFVKVSPWDHEREAQRQRVLL